MEAAGLSGCRSGLVANGSLPATWICLLWDLDLLTLDGYWGVILVGEHHIIRHIMYHLPIGA
eukprot:7519881-Karenia_brevis.AAC.1